MSRSNVSGPFHSEQGFETGVGTPIASIDATNNATFVNLTLSGNLVQGSSGAAGARQTVLKQVDAIADATATDILTITIPNIAAGAGGRILVSSTITQTGHVGDSTRTVEYIWSVTRVAGAVAVITISIITGGTVIATSAAGYTLTSTLDASAVSGGATATNTFTFRVTNTGSTASTTRATVYAECLNSRTGGVTIA